MKETIKKKKKKGKVNHGRKKNPPYIYLIKDSSIEVIKKKTKLLQVNNNKKKTLTKMKKDLNTHFIIEDASMANKHK